MLQIEVTCQSVEQMNHYNYEETFGKMNLYVTRK
jgi:hypothetical protein